MPLGVDLSTLNSLFLYLTAVFAAFLAALWLGLIFWVYRDIRTRTRDRLVHILAALLIALVNLPGLVIYLVLRPPHTLDEQYQSTLEEEALLSEIESRPLCPGCGGRTQADWQVCPVCHTRLRKPCGACRRLLELPWKLCPYCGAQAAAVRPEDSQPIGA